MLIILFLQSLIIWSPWTSWLLNFSGNYSFDRFIFYCYLRLKNHIITYHESQNSTKFFKLGYTCFTILCCAVQLRESAVSIHTSPSSWVSLPLPHPIHLGHHRAPSWASCTIQQLPTSCLFYTWWCIYSSHSPSSSTPFLPLCPHICSLHLHSCPANRFICTITLDSTHALIYNHCFLLWFLAYQQKNLQKDDWYICKTFWKFFLCLYFHISEMRDVH